MFRINVEVTTPFCRCPNSEVRLGMRITGTEQVPEAEVYVRCQKCGHTESTPFKTAPITFTTVPAGPPPSKHFRD